MYSKIIFQSKYGSYSRKNNILYANFLQKFDITLCCSVSPINCNIILLRFEFGTCLNRPIFKITILVLILVIFTKDLDFYLKYLTISILYYENIKNIGRYLSLSYFYSIFTTFFYRILFCDFQNPIFNKTLFCFWKNV